MEGNITQGWWCQSATVNLSSTSLGEAQRNAPNAMPYDAAGLRPYTWLKFTSRLRAEREDMSDVGVWFTLSTGRHMIDARKRVLLCFACRGRTTPGRLHDLCF